VSYRPEGYYKKATKLLLQFDNGEIDFPNLIDGIADAMLETLIATGQHINQLGEPDGLQAIYLAKGTSGTLIFIKDEEN